MIKLKIEDIPIKVGDVVSVFNYLKIKQNAEIHNFDMVSEEAYNLLNKELRTVIKISLSHMRNGDVGASVRVSAQGSEFVVYYPYECEPGHQFKVELL